MKKVIIIHGFHGTPNGNWKPWLLAELEKLDIYATSIALPNPNDPSPEDWVDEIAHQAELDQTDEIYLVGHSLGSTAILRYFQTSNSKPVSGIILISGPCTKNDNRNIDKFLEEPFEFPVIKSKSNKFLIIHRDNDPYVDISNAHTLSKELDAELIIVPNGGHFNSASGYFAFKECLDGLVKMFNE
jgi:uncharacterized protein